VKRKKSIPVLGAVLASFAFSVGCSGGGHGSGSAGSGGTQGAAGDGAVSSPDQTGGQDAIGADAATSPDGDTSADGATSGGDSSADGGDEAATTSDGGGSGDGSTDTAPGSDAGSKEDSGCAGLFCEDFEQGQGQLDPVKWDVKTGAGGTEIVQQQIVAHGKYAWHVHGTGTRGDFAMIMTKNAPLALKGAGPVFGRAYLYSTTNVSSHIELGFAGTTRDPTVAPTMTPLEQGINFNYMEFAQFAGSWQLGFDLFAPAPSIATGFVEEASYPPARDRAPAGTWNCIEWEFGDDPDKMILWVDGKQIDQLDVQHLDFTTAARTPGSVLNGKSSGIIGGFSFFGFGFHSWGASIAVDRYYDDIVLDTKRVNCLSN
jgi:hypothetical protein